jgi:hypothetical protein
MSRLSKGDGDYEAYRIKTFTCGSDTDILSKYNNRTKVDILEFVYILQDII